MALLAAFALIQGCGGGGGSTAAPAAAAPSGDTIAPPGANVHPISVNLGLIGNVNLAFTSVTLCAPGSSSNCQTIDNIVIDTGSSGLRIVSSALAASLALTQQTDVKGNPVVACAHFVDGYTWGPVKLADLKLAGERANSLPIQVIGDPDFPTAPARCAATGPSKNSVQALRANGILGVSVFRQDCGSGCAQPNNRGIYYSCASSVCEQTPMPLAQQVQNPVSMFAVNNNGVIIQLPSVPAAGAARVDGSLVFGIGTQANNGLGAATVVGLDPSSANFTTLYNGVSYSASFVDSGSNGLFFQDSMPVCASTSAAPGFYCPESTVNGAAAIQGAGGTSATVSFSIANAATLLAANPGFAAFANLGAPFAANGFDWGLPFFYGRNVYTAIEGAGTPAGPGPYVAF
ncbi:MAG: DUF3443 domain-containing protein [Betaproteobacteria bacterium]|nr:DUF3443 domain-containing protein [Betaproteobacteria bacterium]